MKLYNEFEVKFAMDVARCQPHLTFDEVLKELTPIELPSDGEIDEEAQKQWGNVHRTGVLGFINCGKWMRDKLILQQNETE